MNVKAIYKDPKENPFSPNPMRPIIRAEVPDEMTKEKIAEFAKEATPPEMEFVDVVMDDNSPIE